VIIKIIHEIILIPLIIINKDLGSLFNEILTLMHEIYY